MSKIVYKPHCEQCGALIEQEVRFKKTVIELPNRIPHLYYPEHFEFDPYRCIICGAIFDSAEVQLPEEEKGEILSEVTTIIPATKGDTDDLCSSKEI